MLRAAGFGSVFVTDTDREEDLELIARSDSPAT
jgi:hypothetical protein